LRDEKVRARMTRHLKRRQLFYTQGDGSCKPIGYRSYGRGTPNNERCFNYLG